jgi:hypothetical protein
MNKNKNNSKNKEHQNGNGSDSMNGLDVRQALVLLCLYLSAWEEDSRKHPGQKIQLAWKGYLFDDLNNLSKEGLIYQKSGYKSVMLTDRGKELAQGMKDNIFKSLNVQA